MNSDIMVIMLLYVIAVILGFAFFPVFTACFFISWMAFDFFAWLGKKLFRKSI